MYVEIDLAGASAGLRAPDDLGSLNVVVHMRHRTDRWMPTVRLRAHCEWRHVEG